MSTFPNAYDSDVEIPRVDKEVTEISGDVINSLRDAVFAIQKVIGLNSQGNKATFADRVNVSIGPDGRIKSSSLEGLGILALPVIDKHIGINAGIQESKLALEYGTSYLKGLVASLSTTMSGISTGVSSTTAALNLHILGQGNYHDGYHIKVNVGSSTGVAGLTATTIGDAINEISGILLSGTDIRIPHIDTSLSDTTKHMASEIGVDATNFVNIDATVEDVQAALDSIDESAGALGVAHVDRFHANGILKEIDSSQDYNPNRKLLGRVIGATYSSGSSIISVPHSSSYASLNITAGDILEIESAEADQGTYQIRAVGPLSSTDTLGEFPELDAYQLDVFNVFSEDKIASDEVWVNVYKPIAASNEFAPLACAIVGAETTQDTISVMNPNSARVVSIGFNGSILDTDGYEIGVKVGIGNSQYRELVIPGLHLDRLGTGKANPVTSKSVAERINAYVSDPDLGFYFPITAYGTGDEFAIAHNWPGTSYTLEILDGYSANYALGLDAYGADILGEEIYGSDNSLYSVNGISLNSIQSILTGTVSITSDTSTMIIKNNSGSIINPLDYGIKPGMMMHVSGHPTLGANGSYVLFAVNSTSVSLFGAQTMPAPTNPTTFTVKFDHAHISLNDLESTTENDRGLVQVLIDANGKTLLHQRLHYGFTIGSAVEIINISPGFPVGDVMFRSTLPTSNFVDFNIVDGTVSGDVVRIHENFKGSFNLYHPNGLDYLTVKITDGAVSGGTNTVVTVDPPLPYDEAFLLCTVHFDGTHSITNVIDNRLFGNIGPNEVRDDFIEVYSQRPVSDLRSNGVVRGFDVLYIPYYDFVTNMVSLPLRGGVAYVNGVRLAIETQKVIVHSYDNTGAALSKTQIVGINDFGSLQVLDDELGEILTDGYNASSEYGKILPLYQITITDGLITDVIDIRRFINNLDDRLDMVIDETNHVVGNFRSLEGALLYISRYPDLERLTVKIINSVNPSGAIVVPRGVSIIGDVPFGADKHEIVNSSDLNGDFITLMGDNRLENINIVSSTVGLQGALVSVIGSNVNIEKCKLTFNDTISSNSGDFGIKIEADGYVNIVNNRIDNVYTGVSSELGCDGLIINDNQISGISGGVGGISCGIKIGTSANTVNTMSIRNNRISLDASSGSDLRGIFVDIGETIESLRIQDNNISGLLDIISENNISNGIRISNESSTGSKINQLLIAENYINNIKLRDNYVYGIYVSDVVTAMVSHNIVKNVAGYDPVYSEEICFIWVGENVDLIDIQSNILGPGGALRGICISNAGTKANIVDNTISQIGETGSQYIYGNGHRSNISGNNLVGLGYDGIYWQGEKTKISNNHFSASDPLSSYSFRTAITAAASNIDIVGNTITDMNHSGGTAIRNRAASQDSLKIIGNTIDGKRTYAFIEIFGNYHVVANNYLKSLESYVGSGTKFIVLGSGTIEVNNATITGNVMTGYAGFGIYAESTVTNITITNNNFAVTSFSGAPVNMEDDSVSGCVITGNTFPPVSYTSSEFLVGPAYNSSVLNENLIGINKGFPDTRSYPASAAITTYDEDATDGLQHPHWIFVRNATGSPSPYFGPVSYWKVNTDSFSGERSLYFPIVDVPNGSTITGFQVQFKNESGNEDFYAQLIRTPISLKVSGGLLTETLIEEGNLGAASADTGYVYITNGDGWVGGWAGGLINGANGGTELDAKVDHSSHYYSVRITHTKQNPINSDNIRIYGIVLFLKY